VIAHDITAGRRRIVRPPGEIRRPARSSTHAATVGVSVDIERFPVAWESYGYTDADLDELVEQMLRMTQSLVIDPGIPPRTGAQLRTYLRRWLATAVLAGLRAR
jgi:hypothetical protein